MEFMCVCIKDIDCCALTICSAFFRRIILNILDNKNTVITEIINYYSGLNVVDNTLKQNIEYDKLKEFHIIFKPKGFGFQYFR